jgi:hypothetical protein
MAAEPITVFSRRVDPEGLYRYLDRLGLDLEIEGTLTAWTALRIRGVGEQGPCLLTLTHDPAYYAEPNWSRQMQGMAEYFARFPESPNKERVLMLPTSLHFSLGTLFDPDMDPPHDPRLPVLFEVAQYLDGVLFTPSSLRDAQGRVLLSAYGPEEEDPEARWPEVVGEVSVNTPLGRAMHEISRPRPEGDEPPEATPPSAHRVARRALALTALTVRAILEQDAENPSALATLRDVLEWSEALNLADELEPEEAEIVALPLGALPPQGQIEATWRLEGLVVLAWALERYPLPAHDALVELSPLWQSLGLLDVERANALVANAQLRSREEIHRLRQRLFALNWRLREFRIRRKAIDFAAFAQTAWFGPLDLGDLPLVENDLAVGGVRLDQADEDLLGSTQSATHERHHASNWLWEGPERYSEVIVAT